MKKKLFTVIPVYMAAAGTVSSLFSVLIYTLIKGVPHLSADLFSLNYTSENGSLVPALINTLTVTFLALAAAVPLGVFAAIFLTEYAGRKSRFAAVIRTAAETLTGIPSIVYGLFGFLMFVIALGWGYSVTAGAFTLAIMILPVIMRTTEEALAAVPDTFREGSFGLGAGKLRTVFRIVLPSALPGIVSGIVLSVGRITGETAALIYTAGTAAQFAAYPAESGRTLSVHMYSLWREGLAQGKAYATAVVIIALVVLLNLLSHKISKRCLKE